LKPKKKDVVGEDEYEFETEGTDEDNCLFAEDMRLLEEGLVPEEGEEMAGNLEQVQDFGKEDETSIEAILDNCHQEAILKLGKLPAKEAQSAVLILSKVCDIYLSALWFFLTVSGRWFVSTGCSLRSVADHVQGMLQIRQH
jgi:hypothetical protein